MSTVVRQSGLTYGIVAAIVVGTILAVVGVVLGTLVEQMWFALFVFGEVVTFSAIGLNWRLIRSRRKSAE